nr:site-specific integrase [Clostridioides mangenotii]
MFVIITTIINSALEYAVDPLQIIKYNPYKDVRLPKYKNKEKKEVQTITKEQFNQLLKAFPKGDLYHILLQIGYYTGMRCGEVCALTWDDIDFKKKTINIKKTMVLDEATRKHKIDTPKTQSSYRVITIGDTLTKILKEHKIYQKEIKLKLGEFYHDKDYPIANLVCTSKNGNFTRNTTISSKLGITVKNKLGFEFNFHMLRHTHEVC